MIMTIKNIRTNMIQPITTNAGLSKTVDLNMIIAVN